MALDSTTWIFAIITIAFCASSFGNGANDVANSYATSVAARTLNMKQVGVLSMCTEFVGAVALGSRVTKTIKNGIIDIKRFTGEPEVLVLAMGCAEIASATWLLVATHLGFPVSTTQTVVGALCGVGIAAGARINWEWSSGSVSQVAASWAIAPALAGCFAAVIFGVLKYSVLERQDSFKWAMRLIPLYMAVTASILTLFLVIEAPTAPSLEEFGPGKAVGIILGVFFGVMLIAYGFFMPYFNRRLVKKDPRIAFRHVILGPLLWKENPSIPWPAKGDGIVTDYYATSHHRGPAPAPASPSSSSGEKVPAAGKEETGGTFVDAEHGEPVVVNLYNKPIEAREKYLEPTKGLSITNPRRLWAVVRYVLLRGVSKDCVTHSSDELAATHSRAKKYDNRSEHLFTYCQVASAMLMSIAHGSNDVANAIGPWSAAYETWQAGEIATNTGVRTWMLAVAGFLLGAGFWFFGYHIIRSLGNKITQMSPSRGFSIELGAATTVLLASRLALPVSTTQCLTGAALGVALMNYDLKAVNWKQLGFILLGWILTLPCAGLIAGLLMGMSLNTPHF